MPLLIQPYKDVTFVIKKELAEMPIFKHIVLTRDPIVVGRQNPREDFKLVMDKGTELLNNGRSVIIYPQTTRTIKFDPKSFNTIGVKLAKKAKVPVVPVALKTDAWGNGKLIKDLGKIDPNKIVYFKFFEPFVINGNGKEEHQKIIGLIEKSLEEWKHSN
jgi:1-acyl-sn-glycerol-3-phosphate acyltransferase